MSTSHFESKEVKASNLGATSSKYNAEIERKHNVIGNRIREARRSQGMTIEEFCHTLRGYGVSVGKGAAAKWERGLSSPSAYQLIAITQALRMGDDLSSLIGVAGHSALNSEGIAKLNEYRDLLLLSGKFRPKRIVESVIRYVDMPISDLPVSAGTGELLDEDHREIVRFPEDAVPRGADLGIRVKGDSMEPVYQDGRIVWMQQCDKLSVGEVGIFIYDGAGYIKVYGEQEPNDPEPFTDSYNVTRRQPVLISYNEAYAPIIVSPFVDFRVVGRVLND